eukprot:10843585-Ditylum_brightwellii.AAC.2
MPQKFNIKKDKSHVDSSLLHETRWSRITPPRHAPTAVLTFTTSATFVASVESDGRQTPVKGQNRMAHNPEGRPM